MALSSYGTPMGKVLGIRGDVKGWGVGDGQPDRQRRRRDRIRRRRERYKKGFSE